MKVFRSIVSDFSKAVVVGLLGMLVGCTSINRAPAENGIAELRLIGVQTVAKDKFQETGVGGFSGLDYDRANDAWVAISDDKSDQGPGRFYTVKLDYDEKEFRSARVTAVQALRQPDGSDYPNERNAKPSDVVPDFEAIRLDPRDGSVWYTHEGLRRPQTDPLVRHAKRDGTFLADMPTPPQLKFAKEKGSGPRFNETFEGLSFSTDGNSLWVGMEGALQQDRAPAGSGTRDPARFTEFDREGKILRQIAYVRDPIVPKIAAEELADNGVSEIFAVSRDTLLVLERSGSRTASDNVWRFGALLFEAKLSAADDVAAVASLGDAPVKAATKRLLYNFDSAGQPHIDNLECIALGRKLPNGHDTLVIASDDNFTARQVNQFWVFEIIPAKNSQMKRWRRNSP
ncbi:esterase-like activity of phytase family protein [Oleiharenicola lentus]|uniref:esterase-like activity of phytase family protein n=1 Tax=Oleiharenicola lentus TaxID=2508720 RepID=UPI003F673723